MISRTLVAEGVEHPVHAVDPEPDVVEALLNAAQVIRPVSGSTSALRSQEMTVLAGVRAKAFGVVSPEHGKVTVKAWGLW